MTNEEDLPGLLSDAREWVCTNTTGKSAPPMTLETLQGNVKAIMDKYGHPEPISEAELEAMRRYW